MMKYMILFFLPFILMASSCNKAEPDECMDCLGAFRCEINGEEWGPDCDSGTILWGCSAIDCLYYNDSKSMDIRVVNNKNNDRIRFSCYDLIIGENPVHYLGREYINYNKGNCGGYDLIRNKPNSVYIDTIDTINQTISGTFHFYGIGHCGDSLKVENGYFHLGYRF